MGGRVPRLVIGLTGLFHRGPSGEVEPVVVAESARYHGVARLLIDRVVEESRGRGYEYLAIRPVARNAAALTGFTPPFYVLCSLLRHRSAWVVFGR